MSKDSEEFYTLLDSTILKDKHPPTKHIRPSMIGSCTRKQYYTIKQFPEETTMSADTKFKLDIGTATHRMIQDIIQRIKDPSFKVLRAKDIESPEGVSVKDHPTDPIEVSFNNSNYGIPVKGSCDGLIEVNGTRYIFELKTSRRKYYVPMSKGGEIAIGYQMQDALYAANFNIHNIMFMVIDKDTQERHIRTFTITQDQISFIDKRIGYLIGHIQTDQVPEKEDTFLNCYFCPYKKLCKSNES